MNELDKNSAIYSSIPGIDIFNRLSMSLKPVRMPYYN